MFEVSSYVEIHVDSLWWVKCQQSAAVNYGMYYEKPNVFKTY